MDHPKIKNHHWLWWSTTTTLFFCVWKKPVTNVYDEWLFLQNGYFLSNEMCVCVADILKKMHSIQFEHLNNLFTNSQFSDNIWQPASQPSLLKVQGFFRLRKWKERKKSIGRLTIGQPNYKLFKQVSYLETITQFTTKKEWQLTVCTFLFLTTFTFSFSERLLSVVVSRLWSVTVNIYNVSIAMDHLPGFILFCLVFSKMHLFVKLETFCWNKIDPLIWKLLILSGEVFQKPVNRKTN